MKKRKLEDTCRYCDAFVWQYDKEGMPYCETHARWSHAEIERLPHPFDSHHGKHVLLTTVEKAEKSIINIIKRIGYAEAFWVAEHLALENGVQWWNESIVIRLTDLQLISFAAAMKAHRAAMYPKTRTKNGKAGKQKKKRRFASLL